MAEVLTTQQRDAVYDRGGRLLVSAAAGSGKTKVLVDRLLSYLNDPVDPADLDDFLIITYTKAAAAELRGKIAAKLSEHMAADPENRHLHRQMQLLYLARISTVHSFCADILKEYAYLLDLPADFRVADENECVELRSACVEKLLDAAYENAMEDPDFCAFVDTQGLARDDRLIPEILLKVYDSSRCHTDPDAWLDACVERARLEGVTDAAETVWGEYLMADLHRYLDMQIEAMEHCAVAAAASPGMDKAASVLSATVHQLQMLRSCGSWDEVVAFKEIDYGRLTFPKKDLDSDLAERIKAVRDACKKGVADKLKSFADPSAIALADMADCAVAVRGMVNLVKRFSAEYDRVKRSRRVLDFGDLEQRTLDLLMGKNRSGATAVAREVSTRFREIMVDEYQDSNAVQDAIFMTLSEERQNCFMVGDVKQSIYQFRLADPGIFLEKYRTYTPKADAVGLEPRKVLLTKNFRSAGAVLEGVNDVFRACMSQNVGGLDYTDEEALAEGVPREPLNEPAVELLAVEVHDSTYAEEADVVAQRIVQLTDGSHFIRDGQQLRAIRPEDIAILLRSPNSSGSYYISALARQGIRCVGAGGDDLLQQPEILALRAILQVVSNPRQDIPLLTALTSPVFCFTADDLAALRAEHRGSCVYDSLLKSHEPKVREFLDILSVLRRTARLQPLAELVEKVFSLTRMDSIYAAMDAGDLRRANLLTFFRLAAEFESGGHRDLEQFLEHISVLEGKGIVKAGAKAASGAVTLTSIHKSKGLEYPVVIVSGLSRQFNREDIKAQVLCDQRLGLGLSAVDSKNRLRYPTLAKRAITVKTVADSVSEEMRVLYVALTRARDRLIMTYAMKNPQKEIAETVNRMGIGNRELLTSEVVCPGEWVLMAALRHTEAGALFAVGGRPEETTLGDPAWHIDIVRAPQAMAAASTDVSDTAAVPDELLQQLKAGLSFAYPHIAATVAPSKQTATQRKGRLKDEEAAEYTPVITASHSWRQPNRGERRTAGKEQGNAIHAALQHIRFECCADLSGVELELQRLVQQRILSAQQREMVDAGKLYRFFATPVGQLLRSGQQVLREFKFSILDDGANFDAALAGEQILLQGVVDCAIVEPDGITVIDFKSDRVTEDTMLARARLYAPQVNTYADALSRIWQLNVKRKLLYFFEPERFVDIAALEA